MRCFFTVKDVGSRQNGDLLVNNNGDQINDRTDAKEAAGDKPQNSHNDTGGIALGYAIQSAVNSIRKDYEQQRCDPRKCIQRVSQFFHLLESVFQVKGNVITDDGYEMTLYSSCCNTDKGIYYYKTYYNSRINAVCMNYENLEGNTLYTFEINTDNSIEYQN